MLETGIKTSYQIKNNDLIANIEVPEQIKTIQVTDSATTIKKDTLIVKEKRKGFFEGIKKYIGITLIIIGFVALIKLIW